MLLVELCNFRFECMTLLIHIFRLSSILNIVNAGNGNGNDLLELEEMATIRIIPTWLTSPRCHKYFLGLTLSASILPLSKL